MGLHLRQFIDAALTPAEDFASLTDATRVFEDAGVTDLIVDRYNGGLLSVADTMMDLLAGYAPPGEASYKIRSMTNTLTLTMTAATGAYLMCCRHGVSHPHCLYYLGYTAQPASWSSMG